MIKSRAAGGGECSVDRREEIDRLFRCIHPQSALRSEGFSDERISEPIEESFFDRIGGVSASPIAVEPTDR